MSIAAGMTTATDEILSRKAGCNWSSFCTIFFRLLQLCNSVVICLLVILVLTEYKRIDELEAMLPAVQQEIAGLETEVQTKQQTQIQQLDKEVQEEHDLTFLTLAGIFTLLTCLISMFHMSSHLQKMEQPIIQRKIVAILWMSPIYGVTSFLSLLYPPMDDYLAIIKDFYESYCIYTFLSFLIAVLGRGSREKAAEVLAKHADHMEAPTRLLSCWYDPPPESSPVAKASAVITECQIMAMQFVFIRPLTTVIYVIYKATEVEGGGVGGTTNTTIAANNTSVPDSDTTLDHGGNRSRWLPEDAGDLGGSFQDGNQTLFATLAPTVAPLIEDILGTEPPDEFWTEAPFANETSPSEEDFGQATKAYFTSFSFFLTMIVNVSVFFAFAGLLKFYHVVHEDLKWCSPWPKFLTIKGVVFLTFWQGLMILIIVNLNSEGDDPSMEARRYQNILICMEMLLFSITHWCVFPAEEWHKDYRPPDKVNKPGIGIQDFVSDVGYIVKSGRQRRRNRRGKFGSRSLHERGAIYHKPIATDSNEDIPCGVFVVDTSPTAESGLSRPRSFSDGHPGEATARHRSFSEGFQRPTEEDDSSDDMDLL